MVHVPRSLSPRSLSPPAMESSANPAPTTAPAALSDKAKATGSSGGGVAASARPRVDAARLDE